MDAVNQNKRERINLRVKSEAKRLIARAADVEGKTVSHFILTSALEACRGNGAEASDDDVEREKFKGLF